MVFDVSGEVWLGTEEDCNSCVLLCEDLDDCWWTEDSWVGLMTESLDRGCTGINGDGNLLLFELLSLLLDNRLPQGVLCEELDYCWLIKDSWDGLMNELFSGGETYITVNDKSLLFEWQELRLTQQLSRGFVCCLLWLFPVPVLWRLPIPLKRGTMNAIWVCGCVACLLFCLSMVIKSWESNVLHNNCSHVWVYEPRTKIDYELFVSISYYIGSKIWPL